MGNSAADDVFRRLYAENFDVILRYALRRVNRPEDAADVVGEVFLVAWRRREEIPPAGEARLWLYGVARRVLANHSRGEQRRHQLGERLRLELREHMTMTDPMHDLVEDRAVRQALGNLDRVDREVLELTVWEQLAPREIAAALGLSSQVVRARLSRARARMRTRSRPGPGDSGTGPAVRTMPVPEEGKA